jgi:uncharacterized protein YegJ (DUF2314 family)
MKFKKLVSTIALIICCACGAYAQDDAGYATPEDKAAAKAEQKKYEEALKPHLEEAKKTYPDARKRFLAGLAPGERFLITLELKDEKGIPEKLYVEVGNIKDGVIKGTIATNLRRVTKIKRGDKYSFPEAELIDWMIVKPDGSEEGNFVGKFLNEYRSGVRSY